MPRKATLKCEVCGATLTGRQRQFCSTTCKTRAWRKDPVKAEMSREWSRQWKEERRRTHPCKKCGEPRAGYELDADLCRPCANELLNARKHKEAKRRTRRMLALRRQGYLNHEIAKEMDTTQATVATMLQRARVARFGFSYVPSPYWERGKAA